MPQVVIIITGVVYYFVVAMQFLMLFRALLSWFPIREDSPLSTFLHAVTEPIVTPVRLLLERFEAVKRMPIDISFFVAMMILVLIQALLPPVRF